MRYYINLKNSPDIPDTGDTFNHRRNINEGKKEFVPKYTIGGTMHDADNPPGSDEEKRMQQIEASIKMNKSTMGRIFSPFTKEQLQSPYILKSIKGDE